MTNVIAIDGPSYVGKSTVARCLAQLTGYVYINTGHMYRAVAKKCLETRLSTEDVVAVATIARAMRIEFKPAEEGNSLTFVDGEDMTQKLASHEIVIAASRVASIPAVREILTDLQRSYAKSYMIIMEGRDIGSTVFPDARWKFFITASPIVRARRMRKVMDEENKKRFPDAEMLIPKIEELDRNDTSRKISPLRQAEDAIVYDNSESPTEKEDALVLNSYLTGELSWKK